MRAILSDRITDADRPPLGPHDLRIRVRAAGVNRADLLQRAGQYPPPPGASPVLGLECAGEVMESNVDGWSAGDRAMALLAGGGYAEEAVVDAGSAMRIPPALTFEEAAAIPETFLTAFLNVFELARARSGETLLVHGGGSGVGTSAITLAKLAGLRVIVTAGSREKCERCRAHGADDCINYKEEDFVARAKPVDIILDHLGASYLARDLQTLSTGGRVVVIGSMGGQRTIELDVNALLAKRQQILGSTFRARPAAEKADIVASFPRRFGKDMEEGRVRPVIDAVFSWGEMEAAHERMRGDHFGKIVLRIEPSSS